MPIAQPAARCQPRTTTAEPEDCVRRLSPTCLFRLAPIFLKQPRDKLDVLSSVDQDRDGHSSNGVVRVNPSWWWRGSHGATGTSCCVTNTPTRPSPPIDSPHTTSKLAAVPDPLSDQFSRTPPRTSLFRSSSLSLFYLPSQAHTNLPRHHPSRPECARLSLSPQRQRSLSGPAHGLCLLREKGQRRTRTQQHDRGKNLCPEGETHTHTTACCVRLACHAAPTAHKKTIAETPTRIRPAAPLDT